MRKKLIVLFLVCSVLLLPSTAAAAPFKIGFSVTKPDEGIFCSELVYNDQVIWRVQLLSDGAKPVVNSGGGQTTIMVPDIINGLFMVKISRE